jgi:hypothetical protein
MTKEPVDAQNLSLLSFHVFEYTLVSSKAFKDQPVTVKAVTTHAFAEYRVDETNNVVGIRLYIRLAPYQAEAYQAIEAQFGIEYHFKVNDLEAYLTQENGQFLLPESLIGTLLSIAYSTSRGLVYDRLQGTYLQDAILPIISPMNLLETDSSEAENS